MRQRPFRLLCALGLIALAGSSPRTASGADAAIGEAARYLPADETFAYSEFPAPGAVFDRIEDGSLRELLSSVPGIQRALKQDKRLKELQQAAEFVAGALQTTPVEGARNLIGGGIAAALTGREKPETLVLFVRPSDPAFLKRAHDKLVELARNDAREKGKPDPVKEDMHAGIKTYSTAPNEAHAIVRDTLVIASGDEALRAILDRIENPQSVREPLSEHGPFASRRKGRPDGTVAWAFARVDRLRQADPKTYTEQPEPGALFLLGPWIEAVRQADWAAASLVWTEGRLGLDVDVAPTGKPPAEAMKGFIPPEGRGAPAPLRPPGTIASLSLYRDMAAIWENRGEIFPPEAQQGFAQLDTFAGQFFGGRDFGSGVLGALGQNWRLIVARQDAKNLDPVPDVVTPAVAIVLDLNDDDPDFAQRLMAAYQSFVGLVNLGAAETKAPPLMLGSESFEDVTISTARFLPAKDRPKDEPVHIRHNLNPSTALVDGHFILSSSLQLCRDLIKALKNPSEPTPATLVVVAEGDELSRLVAQNQERLVTQNMLEKGNDRERAEQEIALLERLAKYFGKGNLSISDTPEGLKLRLNFDLAR